MNGKREKPIDSEVTDLLIATRRRCCLCYFLDDDRRRKKVQIAHINKKRSDSLVENLVPLCLDHHDEYDSITRQSKNITEYELKKYKEMLIKELSSTTNLEEPKAIEQRLPDLSTSIFYDYGNLFFTVTLLLFNHDPIGINFGDNPDEYVPEVHDIIARLQDNPNKLTTVQICNEVFNDWFGKELIHGIDFTLIAEDINIEWKKYIENSNVYE